MGALLLDSINQPKDLKQLNEQQVKQLCAEIRQFLLENISKTGGHLASNLGVVELTVALHRVLDTPQDKIVFDVGHQCYTHKLLTGRYNEFTSLRVGADSLISCASSTGSPVSRTRTRANTMHSLPGTETRRFRLRSAWRGPKSCIMKQGLWSR